MNIMNLRSLFLALVFCVLPIAAAAGCPAPSAAGVALCQPSPDSVINQTPHIEASVTPSSGSVAAIKVYIDNQLSFENGGPGLDLFQGGVPNGTHLLVINAWDNFGRLYQAKETFSVTGNPPACPPSAVGVRICAPAPGEFVPQDFDASFGFKGGSAITMVRAFIDGKDVFDAAPQAGMDQILADGFQTAPGAHTLVVVASDAANRVYKSSVRFNTYYDGNCPPKGNAGCNPGIVVAFPLDGDDVQPSFRVSAAVQNNPVAIAAMKTYLDGIQVGESSGPVFDQEINAPKGTHIMVIQAWDAGGKLYRVVENVNVL